MVQMQHLSVIWTSDRQNPNLPSLDAYKNNILRNTSIKILFYDSSNNQFCVNKFTPVTKYLGFSCKDLPAGERSVGFSSIVVESVISITRPPCTCKLNNVVIIFFSQRKNLSGNSP